MRPAARRAAARVLLAAAALAALGAEAPPRVLSVEVEGNVRVSREDILGRMQTRPGGPFSEDVLNEDLGRIRRAFDAIRTIEVVREDGPRGVAIRLRVRERDLIREVRFEGLRAIRRKTVEEAAGLKEGKPLVPELVRAAAARVLAACREAGYPDAGVRLDERFLAEGVVVFQVSEGEEMRIAEVRIAGLRAFPERDAYALIETRPRSRVLLVTVRRGILDTAVLERDRAALEGRLRDEGFLDARALPPRREAGPDGLVITLPVEEGERYAVRGVRVEGAGGVPEAEIRPLLRVRAGAPWRPIEGEADRAAIQALYEDRGRVDAKVLVRTAPVEGAKAVDVVYAIEEAQAIVVGEVLIEPVREGLALETRDDVIRRELYFGVGLQSGRPPPPDAIERSRRQLQRTGFFDREELSRPGAIRYQDTADPRVKDVVVRLQDAPTGHVQIGAGVSTDAGLFGGFALRQRNFDLKDTPTSLADLFRGTAFKGGGQSLDLSARLGLGGALGHDVSLEFTEPYFFGRPLGFRAGAWWRGFARESWDESRLGVGAGFFRRFGDGGLRTSVDARVESVSISGLDRRAPRDVRREKGSNLVAAIAFRAELDRRDDPSLPSRGWRAAARIEPAVGSGAWVKAEILGEKYWLLGEGAYAFLPPGKHVLSVRGRLGGTAGDPPTFERFYAGGAGGWDLEGGSVGIIRGFSYRSVGPSQRGDPVGGRFLGTYTVEYGFPIWGADDPRAPPGRTRLEYVRGAVFVDAGAASRSPGVWVLGGASASAGVGLRIWPKALLGRVAPWIFVDLAVPVMRGGGGDPQALSFQLGAGYEF